MRSISQPAGNAARKYPPKKATWIKDDWKSLRPKASRKRGIRTSLRLTPSAHKKKSPVTRTKGTRNRRSVKATDGLSESGRAAVVMPRNSSQCPVEVSVAAVHKHVLSGGMARPRRQQKEHGGSNFFRRRHAPAQGDVIDDRIQLLPWIGESVHPPMVKRGHDFSRNHRVDAHTRGKQFGRPFPRQSQNRPLGGHITRSIPLSGDRYLGSDVDDRAAGLFERSKRV